MKSGYLKVCFVAFGLLIAITALRRSPSLRPQILIENPAVERLSSRPTPRSRTAFNPATKQNQVAETSQAKSASLPFAKTIAEEASQLYTPQADPGATDRRLERIAENLNAATAASLVNTALNTDSSANEKFLAVYLLGERARDFTRELQLIALQPVTNTQNANDINVRIQAMLALEGVPHQAKLFDEIRNRQTDPLLIKLARLGAKGARQGQPFIQKYVDMQMAEILDGVD